MTRPTSARVAGLAYLVCTAVGVSNVLAVTSYGITRDQDHELGIASNFAVFAVDVALITALYVVLRPIHRSLALMAAGWGLVEKAILVVVTLSDFDALRILSGAE